MVPNTLRIHVCQSSPEAAGPFVYPPVRERIKVMYINSHTVERGGGGCTVHMNVCMNGTACCLVYFCILSV